MNLAAKPEFTCQNCGKCCGPVPVSKQELKQIRKAIHEMSTAERERIKAQKRKDLTCPLRDVENKRCSVYSARPTVCRLYGHVQQLRCSNNPKTPVMPQAIEASLLRGIGNAVGVLGLDIGWKELEREAQRSVS